MTLPLPPWRNLEYSEATPIGSPLATPPSSATCTWHSMVVLEYGIHGTSTVQNAEADCNHTRNEVWSEAVKKWQTMQNLPLHMLDQEHLEKEWYWQQTHAKSTYCSPRSPKLHTETVMLWSRIARSQNRHDNIASQKRSGETWMAKLSPIK